MLLKQLEAVLISLAFSTSVLYYVNDNICISKGAQANTIKQENLHKLFRMLSGVLQKLLLLKPSNVAR